MSLEMKERGKIRYVYDYGALDRLREEQCSAGIEPGPAATVTGGRAHVAMERHPAATGYELAACAAEQFKYVVRGSLIADLDGRILQVPRGHVLHIPAGMPHGLAAGPEEGAEVVAVTDTRISTSGRPRSSGSIVLSTPRSPRTSGAEVRYVYPIDELDHVPEGKSSAVISPRNFVSGKSSSYGASLKGEMLQVGLIRKPRGSGAKLHTHPNEQFNLVLEGRLVGEIGGYPMEVPAGSIIHMPPKVEHCTLASPDGDVTFFVVKDTSHGMAGPPVDGIEDGPRYLPGFGPAKKN
jgi:quercetin dioxygenase-like cupin family protein